MDAQMSSPQLPDLFSLSTELPVLSATAEKLIKIAGKDVDVDELVGIIEQDPVIAARLIGLSNSAFFAQINPVLSVKDALLRVLGLKFAKNLALTMALQKSLVIPLEANFDAARYWAVSLGTASLSTMLANSLSIDKHYGNVAELSYLSGLLHCTGELFAAFNLPYRYAEFVEEEKNNAQRSRDDVFVEYFNSSILQLSQWIVERWHLPDLVVDTLGQLNTVRTEEGYAQNVPGFILWASHEMQCLLSPDACVDNTDEQMRENDAYISFKEKYDDLLTLARQMSQS